MTENRIVQASREIGAPADVIFELIADPSRQPEWDGNENLSSAEPGQRVTKVGDVFLMVLTMDGAVRENHVVEFEEGRAIAWRPSEVGKKQPGHLWRWELEPHGDTTTVTHTYDWTELHDSNRLKRAQATTSEKLRSSLDNLAALAEQ